MEENKELLEMAKKIKNEKSKEWARKNKDKVREIGVRIDIWTHFMRGCIIDYVY